VVIDPALASLLCRVREPVYSDCLTAMPRSRQLVVVFLISMAGCRPSADGSTTTPSKPHAVRSTATAPRTKPAPRSPKAARIARDDALRPIYGCPDDPTAIRSAREELAALDATIAALGDLDDPAPAVARIAALLESPCLGLARLHVVPLAPKSGLALRLWRERGGLEWLEDAIRFSEGGPALATFPPTMPVTLSRETHPGHPLAPWLCGLHDPACAATTAGWRTRAQQVMGRNDDQRYEIDRKRDNERCYTDTKESFEQVEPLDRAHGEPYGHWAQCMFEAEGDNTEFPLGGLRAPEAGWLFVEGRRGHYAYCDELHAYDLETGAAHVVRSCSQIVFDGIQVDEAAATAGRTLEVRRGVVPRDNVRELAFMLLVAEHVHNPAIPAVAHPKAPLSLALPPEPRSVDVTGMLWGALSDQTTLRWIVIPPGGAPVVGELPWPPAYNRAPTRHAANLFSVAEDGLVPGCAPRGFPAALAVPGTLTGVASIDASRGALDETHALLVAALKDEPRCDRQRRVAR